MKNINSLNLALAQMELYCGQPEKNFQTVCQFAHQAADKNADLILLPELWASGYDLENASKHASKIDQGWFLKMSSLAADLRIAVGGSLIESHADDLYNTFALFSDQGNLLAAYRKIHLFQLLNEGDYLQSGNQLVLIECPWGRTGLATCYDLRFPEIFRAYAVEGAELILLTAEWPEKRIGHWQQLLVARAIENQCFIAAVNKVGKSKGEDLGGRSAVISPMGEILVQGEKTEELLITRINLKQVSRVRSWMPVMRDRKPAVYYQFLDE